MSRPMALPCQHPETQHETSSRHIPLLQMMSTPSNSTSQSKRRPPIGRANTKSIAEGTLLPARPMRVVVCWSSFPQERDSHRPSLSHPTTKNEKQPRPPSTAGLNALCPPVHHAGTRRPAQKLSDKGQTAKGSTTTRWRRRRNKQKKRVASRVVH